MDLSPLTRLLAAASLAMAAVPVAAAAPMGQERGRILLNRTGFGATHEEIRRFAALSVEAAVDRLLREADGAPVELVVGSLRMFQVQAPDMLPFAALTMQLGQALFAPPSVKGWTGGGR